MPLASKWQVEAWTGGPRFLTVSGKTTLSRVFHRDYERPASANRAVPQVHRRFPQATVEMARYELAGGFWMERERIVVRFCLDCDGRLDWVDDMYHCPRCGNEWHDDHFKADREGS